MHKNSTLIFHSIQIQFNNPAWKCESNANDMGIKPPLYETLNKLTNDSLNFSFQIDGGLGKKYLGEGF